MLMLAVGILAAGCGNKQKVEDSVKVNIEETNTVKVNKEETESVQKDTAVEDSKEMFELKSLENIEFYFASGAGGWRTFLTIKPDGTFSGSYSDSEMGSVGENYPNGTYYLSEFDGQFSVPVKVNDYTYSMKILKLEYAKPCDTEEIIDDVLYKYCEAYGITGTEEVLLYLPGAPMKDLPQEYLNWVKNHMEDPEVDVLPFYGLYNVTEQNGFSSYEMNNPVDGMLDSVKNRGQEIRTTLEEDDLTQAEMNEKSLELYELWDGALNTLWTELKTKLSEEEFQQLLSEQRVWITEKEAAVQEAGKEVEGGSLYPMVVNMTGADFTEERVYELYDLWSKK